MVKNLSLTSQKEKKKWHRLTRSRTIDCSHWVIVKSKERKPAAGHKTLSELQQRRASQRYYATNDRPVAKHTINTHTQRPRWSTQHQMALTLQQLPLPRSHKSPHPSIFHSHPSALFPVANVWCDVHCLPKTLHSNRGRGEIKRQKEEEREREGRDRKQTCERRTKRRRRVRARERKPDWRGRTWKCRVIFGSFPNLMFPKWCYLTLM